MKILRSEWDYRWILDGRQLFTDSCPLVTLEFHLLVFTGCDLVKYGQGRIKGAFCFKVVFLFDADDIHTDGDGDMQK